MSEVGEQKPPREIINAMPVKRRGRIIHEPIIIIGESRIVYGPDGKKRTIPSEEKPQFDKKI